MLDVLQKGRAVYEDIIQVHSIKMVWSFLKDIFYKFLKCFGALLRPNGINTQKKAKSGLECSPVVIIRVHFNLVMTTC